MEAHLQDKKARRSAKLIGAACAKADAVTKGCAFLKAERFDVDKNIELGSLIRKPKYRIINTSSGSIEAGYLI